MLNGKETGILVIATIILAFSASLATKLSNFLYVLASIFIILLVNIIAKKIASYYVDSEIEIRLWEVSRYGFAPSKRFKKPLPAGLIIPLVVSILSLGYVKWLASLVFEVKPKVYRAAKRHGLYRSSEMTES